MDSFKKKKDLLYGMEHMVCSGECYMCIWKEV